MLDLLFVMDFVRTNQYCETKEEKDLCKSALNAALNWSYKVDNERKLRKMRVRKLNIM